MDTLTGSGFGGIMRQVKMNKCLCGCGQLAKNRFVRFHHLSGKCNPNNHRVQSDETKRKISIANSGKKWTKKQKENLSNILKKVWQNPELMKKISVIRKQWIGEKNPFYGKKHTEQSKKKIANRHYKSGKDHHWFKPDRTRQYSLEWQDTLKEAIRERDNYICQRCGVPQEECNRQLDVHHIDGDKINCDPSNLIAFCVSCHSKVERNHRSTINRVNSGNSHVDNPEPSSLKCEKVQRLSEEDTSSLITDKSALQLKADDIVRTSEQSEKNGLLWSKRNFIRGLI